ncbi:MAG: aminoglycoside phosphotransferase family protein [Candidatus Pseudobacter hemicellulosilyticus]|uniref:Aminoglycoside phosphotransferase family protein n=1 Tax=Candidatus Pseudobacter hemicellulosilyticus TaxID=3121375 RepID=A0AAJ6BEM2_9BACT|nr:MAG: aminoglycoside phosphotransferase family protein [Pseudobacter sp.]
MLPSILTAFGISPDSCAITPFGSGLINHTWRIECGDKVYILQRINHQVFKQPEAIAANLTTIGRYLQQQHPGYLFTHALPTADGSSTLVVDEVHGYFRLFPFVAGSHSIDVVKSTQQAYEAALQFGRFTRLLSSLDTKLLNITLPDFHNLSLRYRQFEQAVAGAREPRRSLAGDLVRYLSAQQEIVHTYKRIVANPDFPVRVIHHDTKISNILFDDNDKGLCVIDLDTVMPGYFISDVGDMLRTYLSPLSEEETDLSRITVREDYFRAIADGYLQEMGAVLTPEERGYFLYSGKFMIYMQALRFLTDYLNNDSYYGQRYEGHNLDRAANQATLLQRLIEKEAILQG